MIKIFNKFVFNKYFITWFIIFLLILYFLGLSYFGSKIDYMDQNHITDQTYLFYTIIFPMAFYEENIMMALIIEFSYLSIISFVIIQFIDHFVNKEPSSTFTRIGRQKFSRNITIFSTIFTFAISLIYIYFAFSSFTRYGLELNQSSSVLIAIIVKILITTLIPNIYLLFYIKSNDCLASTLVYIVFYVFLQIIVKMSFNEKTLMFIHPFLLVLAVIFLLVTIIYLSIRSFGREDLG